MKRIVEEVERKMQQEASRELIGVDRGKALRG
jgi:hypothetical protein